MFQEKKRFRKEKTQRTRNMVVTPEDLSLDGREERNEVRICNLGGPRLMLRDLIFSHYIKKSNSSDAFYTTFLLGFTRCNRK
ncbi:hypothetical protein CEXT_647861 [Caerostris extrusa]|uniref:Uncharacterized protein n=1 Tax=Caerostris extrusa TaxID=172846 RepID=A0AAV4RM74_CAEEX|nr:hypothetical protein CEXT_647861 [Caerostris extrusa]